MNGSWLPPFTPKGLIGLNRLDEGDLDQIPIRGSRIPIPLFDRMLQILDDPDDPEREEYLYWLGGPYDPEVWKSSTVNLSLHVSAD